MRLSDQTHASAPAPIPYGGLNVLQPFADSRSSVEYRVTSRIFLHWLTFFKQPFFIWRSWDCALLKCSSKYNQQDATLYNILYCCQCTTCFGRFLRPSSGAQIQNCAHSTWYVLGLLAARTSSNSPTLAVAALKLTHTRCCVYSFEFELLMMGGETASPPETCRALTIKNIV
jgi:hypothetical protein